MTEQQEIVNNFCYLFDNNNPLKMEYDSVYPPSVPTDTN